MISLFRNGSVQIKNLANANYILDVESGQDYLITPSNGTITLYLNDEVRNNIVWEILGRMCHLLQDMSVPAHTNIDPHGENPGLIDDYYESYFGYNFYWNAQNIYSQIGGMINPYQYQPTNPLHFLMYTTNQMANHFATQGPHKKNNNDYFSGNGTSTEIAYLNSLSVPQFGIPTSETGPFDDNVIFNVREKMLSQQFEQQLVYYIGLQRKLA